MNTLTFESFRTKKVITVVFTSDKVNYIDNSNNDIITIERDVTWHFNEDGLHRAWDFYDDPRFDYWVNMELEYCNN